MAGGKFVVSRAKQRQQPAPTCAAPTDGSSEVCVHETVFQKYSRSGPLEQARKLFDHADVRGALGVAVVALAAWKLFQRRRSDEEGNANEKRSELNLHLDRVSFEDPNLDRQWEERLTAIEERAGRDLLAGEDDSVELDRESGFGKVSIGGWLDQSNKLPSREGFEETRRSLEVDLEESAVESKATMEGLRQGYRHLLIGEAGSPSSSTENGSLKSEKSPVALLLAKAKATSEKVDRIHERLRRLSKGDAPK